MFSSSTPAVGLNERSGRAGLGWLLPSLCAVLGLAVALGNPNYSWSERREIPYGADFLQEWVAGDMLLHGAAESIYDPVEFAAWQHDPQRVGFEWPPSQYYPAVYPPPYYCAVAPLAWLPYRAAALAWLGLMLAGYPAAAWLLQRRPWFRDAGRAFAQQQTSGFWCVALLFPALFMSLVMGQKGTLWLLVVVASWQMWRGERSFAAGCIWALLTVKPTLCCWLPVVMLAHRQWRFCGGVLVGAVALWGATAAVVPASLWSDFYAVALSSGAYQEHAGYRDGWSASLLTLFMALGLPRIAALALWLLSGAAIVLSLIALPRCTDVRKKLEQPEFLLRVLIATALLSPHFYFYDLVWLLFPLAGLFALRPRRAGIYVAMLWLSMLLVQQSDKGWPLLAVALLAILLHSSLALIRSSYQPLWPMPLDARGSAGLR